MLQLVKVPGGITQQFHFCDCGPFTHCGNPIVHLICEHCGDEYVGPDCEVTRPLPIVRMEDGSMLCRRCLTYNQSLQRKSV
ncbi:MAG: hypothetical protein ACOX5R_19450 [bacterium]|jgi:hypothetical protein